VRATSDQDPVFISYSSGDKADADEIVAILEGGGVPCWIAPRDVPAGAVWAESIAAAIRRCRLLLLVLSKKSDESDDVLNELTIAGRDSKHILAVRIRNFHPSERMMYFVGSLQWFNAFEHPVREDAKQLVEAVRLPSQSSPRLWP
jgi:hypothetical protein